MKVLRKEGRTDGRRERRIDGGKEARQPGSKVGSLPRIKLLIAPTTNDVKIARPLSQKYDIL